MKNVICQSFAGLIVLLLAGCQTDPLATREIALLRAEILDLEDQYYALKSEHDEAINTLHAIEGETAPGTTTIWTGADDECTSCDQPVGSGAVLSQRLDHETAGTVRRDAKPSAEPGQVEAAPLMSISTSENRRTQSARRPMPGSKPVDGISIDRRVTVGHDADNILGDEGIELVVQMTDQDGRLTLPDGLLAIQITTADPNGEATTTLGQWQFSPDELEDFLIRRDVPIRGFLFHLPWQDSLPIENQVLVHVSWAGQGGQILDDSVTVNIRPPVPDYRLDSPAVLRWLESDVRWANSTGDDQEASAWSRDDGHAARSTWRPVR